MLHFPRTRVLLAVADRNPDNGRLQWRRPVNRDQRRRLGINQRVDHLPRGPLVVSTALFVHVVG